MARTGVKVLLGIGLVGSAFGAYQVYDRVYAWYDQRQFVPVFIIFGVGLLLLAIGVAKLKGPVIATVVFLAGAAYAGAMLRLGKTRDEERMAGYRSEIDIQKAAAAVCAGTPNTSASETPIDGKRPILGAGMSPGSAEWFSGGTAWHDLPKPRTLAELQLVACTEVIHDLRATCDYQGKNGVGAYSISRVRRVDHITVRDAKTAQVLGRKSFEGGEPATDCSKEITVSSDSRETSRDVTGEAPSDKDETDFVRAFVEQPK